MARITKLVTEQTARAITSFISNITPETKKGNHPVLLTGGVDVEVELKSGLEDKLIITAKVANCVVYREKVSSDQLRELKHTAEALYNTLLIRIIEAMYDNALIADSSLMKLISATGNRHVKDTTLELPAGYTVQLYADAIIILDVNKKRVELQEFSNNGYPLSPALCIPKTITTHMAVNGFEQFNI